MLEKDGYAEHVAARLEDFFSWQTWWQRRLWSIGLPLALEETLEASEAVRDHALSEASFGWLRSSLHASVGNDPGIGEPEHRKLLQKCLASKLVADGYDHRVLTQLAADIEENYLIRWAAAVAEESTRPGPERVARAVASHLLDNGFSQDYLHRWLRYQTHHRVETVDISALINQAHTLVRRDTQTYEVLAVFTALPGDASHLPEWRDAVQASDWFQNNGFDVPRQAGGFLLSVQAHDPASAVERASEIVDRLVARALVGTRSRVIPIDMGWVAGHRTAYRLRRPRRVEVRALSRESKVYTIEASTAIDSALELLHPLEFGPPSPAVAGGWAAIESLLVAPGDTDRVGAADRLAWLVACSFPRAELTTLAYVHQRNGLNQLETDLAACSTNLERAKLMARAIEAREELAITSHTDQAALRRMERLLANPKPVLNDVAGYAAQALRRLYRQRNLVLHLGKVEAVALRASLRTAAPLVGAGIDRIVHGALVNAVAPLDLAARARTQLDLLETASGSSPLELLG